MRIVEITEFGGPDVLQARDAPEPAAGPGEVRIAVDLVEVLFLDTQLRAGWGQDFFPMRPPWVPGTGVAGTIDAVGEGADVARIGERVVARTGNEGAYAESVVVAAADAFVVPDGVPVADATAALHDGVLALDRLERAAITAGQRVLVTAAAGSLGHWFVPLAKATGAHVTGAAGGRTKAEAVRGLGADTALDYRAGDWPDSLAGPYDVVFDGTGGEIGRAAFGATADGGTFFGHGGASGDFATNEPARGIAVIGVESQLDDDTWRRLTHDALAVIGAGRVRPTIGLQVPVDRAADAHRAMADRVVIGKTLLTVPR